ncbi:MAG: PLP-dependent aminotransferase family protein, partial [Clostridiales bacterium]|nr:PLP-dependent aminotransferase family protein [Clostridiales bacterium]
MEQLTIALNPAEKTPLYAQLYHAIRRELAQGHIRTGEKLPSKRTLAASLGISLHTVESAYSQLEAEGYVESRPRSGFYACPVGEPGFAPAVSEPPAPASAPEDADFRYRFSTGGVDTSLFPYATWSRLSKNLMYSHRDYLLPGDSRGDAPLRETLCRYLRQTRGVSCHPDQIIVGAGSEYLLCVLSGLLDDGIRFAMENPCYAKTYQILRNCGRAVDLIPLDKDGIDLQALERSGARAVHITPSHQFPMGMVMPVGRRAALLQWAQERGAYIIEDDYDSEFRFEGRPIPSLQGM